MKVLDSEVDLYFKIYFKIPFWEYWIAKSISTRLFCLLRKEFDNEYYWIKV